MATIVASSTFAVRETQSLGQQMLKEPLGINGLSLILDKKIVYDYINQALCLIGKGWILLGYGKKHE